MVTDHPQQACLKMANAKGLVSVMHAIKSSSKDQVRATGSRAARPASHTAQGITLHLLPADVHCGHQG
jgi:hypothetical protein